MFVDLEEIEELFAEVQAAPIARKGELGGLDGFRVFSPHKVRKGRKSPGQEAYMRAYSIRRADERVRERLLAGERPAGKRGPKPTRWIRIAAELGIDLSAPAPVAP